MVVHAAFGGSTNLLLHIPAIAHAAGLKLPTVEDWISVNRRVPRLVSVLPNGPIHHPTVRVFLAGGVPEVMLHLRKLDLLNTDALTVTGKTLGENLDWWEKSERRMRFRELLRELDGVDADEVIFSPDQARERGLTSTLVFPRGNLAPEGSVVKATAIDPSVVDADGVYRKEGPARVFVSEKDAMAAIKQNRIQAGDVLVLTGVGPAGHGHGRDLSSHRRVETSAVRQTRRAADRRAVFRRLDRRVHRPYRPGRTGGRADWENFGRRHHPHSH